MVAVGGVAAFALVAVVMFFLLRNEGDAPQAAGGNDVESKKKLDLSYIAADFNAGMNLDGTLSTELSLYHKKEDYNDVVTMGLPRDNAGKPLPAQLAVVGAFVPKGAKNVEVAKDFLKYLIQPKVVNEYLKAGLGRFASEQTGFLLLAVGREGCLAAVGPDELKFEERGWVGSVLAAGKVHARVSENDRGFARCGAGSRGRRTEGNPSAP